MTPDEATQLIVHISDERRRQDYLQALRQSLEVPAATSTSDWSNCAGDVGLHFQLSPIALQSYGICITRKGVYELLAALGYSPSALAVGYEMSTRFYQDLFWREPLMLGRAYIYTYGETIALLRRKYCRLKTRQEDVLRTLGYAHESSLYLPTSRIIVSDVSDELLSYFRRHPERLRDGTPRRFEEVIAAIFRGNGYDVEITPASKDGGYDLMAVQHTKITGANVYLVECKRYAPQNKVGVGVVRGLYGIVSSQDATKGVVTTTSSFTRGAQEFAERHRARLSLHDLACLKEWLEGFI